MWGSQRRSARGLILALCAICGSLTQPAVALQDTIDIESIRRATVTIQVASAAGGGQGSGFLLSADGIVVTAAHVIEGATGITVRLMTGEEYQVAGVLVVDTVRDFALVRIAGFGLPTVDLGNSDSVAIGQPIFAFGAPLGLGFTVSDGLVSSERLIGGNRLLQISAPVSPGSSGGPITTVQGSVIGIVVSQMRSAEAENLNFALPINYVRGALAMVMNQPAVPLAQWEWKAAGVAGTPVATVPRSIRISPREAFLDPGERTAFGVDYRVGNDLTLAASVQWRSSNVRVARILQFIGRPQQATLTAIGRGFATIVATIGGLSDSVVVNVRAAVRAAPARAAPLCRLQPSRRGVLVEIQINPPELTLTVGESDFVIAAMFDGQCDPVPTAEPRWLSSNFRVATVQADPGQPTATITAVGPGIAQIEARVGNVISIMVVQVLPRLQ